MWLGLTLLACAWATGAGSPAAPNAAPPAAATPTVATAAATTPRRDAGTQRRRR